MDYGPFYSILVQHKTFLCFRMDVIIKLIAKRLAWKTYVVPGLQQAEMCGSRRGGISGGVGGCKPKDLLWGLWVLSGTKQSADAKR